MPIVLPQKTTIQELNKAIEILGPKVIGMNTEEARKIDSAIFSESNLNTYTVIGLVDESGSIIKLTPAGRDYYKTTSEAEKKKILRERIRQIPIFDRTVEYFYHNDNFEPTKVDVASYWNDTFADQLAEMEEEGFSNASLFFLRLLGSADLGKYVPAGRGRETHIRLDKVKIAEYITSAEATPETIKKIEQEIAKGTQAPELKQETPEPTPPVPANPLSSLSASNIRAFSKLQLELTEKELDSPGAKKLIIDLLDRLERENTVLKAKVETYQKVETKAAILAAKVKSLSNQNLLKDSVNSVGGIILGASLSISGLLNQLIAVGLGLILVVISIALREKEGELEEETAQ